MDDPEPGLLLLSKLPSFSTFYLGFTFEAFVILLIILILLMLSGLVSGAEIAFFSLSPKERADINDGDSKILKEGIKLLNKPKKLLAGILISNNFINISIILISTLLVEIVFNFSEKPIFGVLMQVVVITSMLLFFGEIMPKIFAKQKPIFFIRYMSEPLRLVLIIFKPLIELLSKTTNLIDRRLEKHKPQLSMKDLSEVIELTGEMDNAEVEEEAQKILKGIATFGDTDVKEIMKSRVDVKALEISASFEEVIQHIKEWGYSRIPIYEENLDQIKGVLYIKDLLIFLETPNLDWLAKIRPAFFVPENKKINDLLQEFRSKKIHLAIVVDEYGGTSGIVSLEDVLEEIVGDINDEFDDENDEFQYIQIDEKTWVFEAKSGILHFCKVVGIESEQFDTVKGESDSIAGLILELKGDFPKLHEKINYANIEFKILQMDERRISRVRIKKLDYEEE